MKKNYSPPFKAIAKLAIAFTLFSTSLTAQVGENDSTFNTPDNALSKGTDYGVQLSALQSDNNKIVLAGEFTTYNSESHSKIVRIHLDGTVDNTFQHGTGFNDKPNALIVQPDNRIIAAGNFSAYNGTQTHGILRLLENGSIDTTFSIGTGFDGNIYQAERQPDGKILVFGEFTIFNNQPVKDLLRLNANGTLDTTFTAYDTTYTYPQTNRFAIQADGKIVVAFTKTIEQIGLIRLNANGTRDLSFTSIIPFPWNSYRSIVKAMAIQTDGKILIGGLGFQGNSPNFHFLKRVNTDGSVDTAFAPLNPLFAGSIYSISLQSDGKIIVGGQRDRAPGTEHTESHYIARINADGTFDDTFIRNTGYFRNTPHFVYSTLILSNGKVLVGGYFPEINTSSANNIALLNSDGTVDGLFNATAGVNGTIRASHIQADQKILIGGLFSSVAGQARSHVARLHADGTVDTSFNPGKGTDGPVYAITSQADGKVIIGGAFSKYNDVPANNIVRVYPDGSIDTSYSTGGGIIGVVYTLSIQNDNKVIVGGNFNQVNGVYRTDLTRINADGSLDTTFANEFSASESSQVYTSLILPSGKILVGGNFTARHDYTERKHLVRLNADGTVDAGFGQAPFYDYRDLALQPDGKIIARGGNLPVGDYTPLGFIERYNENGTVDTTWTRSFQPGIKPLHSVSLLPTGQVIVGGEFTWFDLQAGQYIMMMDAFGNIDSSFIGTVDGPVYTTETVADNKVIIGGAFSNYTSAVRNNIARFKGPSIINGVKEYTLAAPFAVYPNPAASFINVDQLQTGSIITVRNVMGALLYSEQVTTNHAVINVSNYANGIYFITQQNKEQLSTQRFIVNK